MEGYDREREVVDTLRRAMTENGKLWIPYGGIWQGMGSCGHFTEGYDSEWEVVDTLRRDMTGNGKLWVPYGGI